MSATIDEREPPRGRLGSRETGDSQHSPVRREAVSGRTTICASRFGCEVFAIAMVGFVAAAAYLPAAAEIGWFSDDYVLVYGLTSDVPTIEHALKHGGHGRYSVHRLLCYPVIGYAGNSLGPFGAHLLLVALHAICGAAIYALLRQLYFWRSAALLASSLFVVSPLASQPVVWWSAGPTAVSTLCILLAAIVHVRYTATRRLWLLPVTGLLAFTSLLFYELWLAGFVLLWGVCFGRVALRSRKSLVSDLVRSFVLTAPLLVPYLLWAILFKLSPPEGVHSPTFSVVRAVVVFASIHVRAAQQLLEWPTLRSALVALQHSGVLMIVTAVATSVLVALIAGKSRRLTTHPAEARLRRSFDRKLLASRLLVAWSVFLASRLVFILQGGVSMQSRHSYGAAIAFGIIAVLMFDAARERLSSKVVRAALTASVAGLLVLWSLSARGVALNYVAVSEAEHAAPQALAAELQKSDSPSACPIFVVGSPAYFRGEFDFFSEDHGHWLRFLMQKQGVPREFITAANMSDASDRMKESRDCSPDGPQVFRVDRKGLSRQMID